MFFLQDFREEALGERGVILIHANVIDQRDVFDERVSFLDLDFFPILIVFDIFAEEMQVVDRLLDHLHVFLLFGIDTGEGGVDFGLIRLLVSLDYMSENIVLVQRLGFFLVR